jgi:hypothetical protein
LTYVVADDTKHCLLTNPALEHLASGSLHKYCHVDMNSTLIALAAGWQQEIVAPYVVTLSAPRSIALTLERGISLYQPVVQLLSKFYKSLTDIQ